MDYKKMGLLTDEEIVSATEHEMMDDESLVLTSSGIKTGAKAALAAAPAAAPAASVLLPVAAAA